MMQKNNIKKLNKEIVAAVELLDQSKVELMLKEGADVNTMDDEEETLITIAAKTSLFDQIKGGLTNFLSYIKDQKKLSKVLAMKKNLEEGGYDFSDDNKSTGMLDATIIAIGDQHILERIKLMQLLLDTGADINLGGDDKLNALFYAASDANTDVVGFLLKNGADPNIIYYPNEDPVIFETILEKVHFDLQITEEQMRDLKLYRYTSIDGMDEEILIWKVNDYKKVIKLLEDAGAK